MNQTPPERVRVTGPPRRRPAGTRTREIDAGTRIGAIYMRSLMGEQLRLALRILGTLMLVVGTLPLLFHFVPGLTGIRVLGIPLPWVLLGFAVYPFLLALGWWYVRSAEANERDFTDLVEEVER